MALLCNTTRDQGKKNELPDFPNDQLAVATICPRTFDHVRNGNAIARIMACLTSR